MLMRRRGSALVIVIVFLVMSAITSIGLYNSIYNLAKMQGIDEVRRIDGYYKTLAAVRYALVLLIDPARNVTAGDLAFTTTATPETRVRSVRNSYANFSSYIGLTAPNDITLTVTDNKTNPRTYDITAALTDGTMIRTTVDMTLQRPAIQTLYNNIGMTKIIGKPPPDNDPAAGQPNSPFDTTNPKAMLFYMPVLTSITNTPAPFLVNNRDVVEVTLMGSMRVPGVAAGLLEAPSICLSPGATAGMIELAVNQAVFCAAYQSDTGLWAWRPFATQALYRITEDGTSFNVWEKCLMGHNPSGTRADPGDTIGFHGLAIYTKVISSATLAGVDLDTGSQDTTTFPPLNQY